MPSQYGQDRFVLEVLDGLQGGFFLDSGAADGVRGSNTQLLEQSYGWNGICVEPNHTLFAQLVRHRRCRCVNCCLYDRDGDVPFLESAWMLGGILETYHPAHLRFAMNTFGLLANGEGIPATVSKPARTVRAILRECSAPPIIDYWSLDTEGSELAILKSFPFDEYAVRVLTVEHNRLPLRISIQHFLETLDYCLVRTIEIDDCYVRAGDMKTVRARAR
jgi:hypothetical protein